MSDSEVPTSIKQASRMRGIACKICSKIYSERNPPLMLLCGHSCCEPCLAQIIDSSKICHVCKRGLIHLDVSHYPINYTVLEVSEESSSVNNLRKRIDLVCKVHEKILSVAESSVSNVMTNKDKVEAMKLNVPKLLELTATEDDILNVKVADAVLDNIERLMNEVAEIFPLNNEKILVVARNKEGVQFDLHSSQFKTNKEFMTKIYNEISNGTLIVAYKIINGVDSFAKVSIDGSLILLHAFRSSPKDGAKESFPKDGHFTSFPKEGQAKLIEFEDYQYSARWIKLRAFIEASGKRLYIDLLSQSVRSYFFLQLCTGEVGASYLNSKFMAGITTSTTINEKVMWHLNNNQYLEYFANRDSYIDCDREGTYARFTLDGSLNISNGLCGRCQNICGLVANPGTLMQGCKVTDCGIGHIF